MRAQCEPSLGLKKIPGSVTDEEEAGPHRIGAHDAGDLALGKVPVDRLPCAPAVGGAEEIGPVVRELVAGRGEIGRVGVVRGELDAANIGELRHVRRRDVVPALAVVAGDMHETVIGRGPDLAATVRRFDERGAGCVGFAPALSRVISLPNGPGARDRYG